jgi:hypothetical protein
LLHDGVLAAGKHYETIRHVKYRYKYGSKKVFLFKIKMLGSLKGRKRETRMGMLQDETY